VTTACGGGLAAPNGTAAARGSVDGGGSNPSGARARGKAGEVVAAEEEHERMAGLRKGWGGLGVRVDRATTSAPPVDSMRVDLIQARRPSRRKGGSGAGQGTGSGAAQGLGACGRAGPRAAAERPAGGEEKQRRGRALEERGERKRRADARGHMARERKGEEENGALGLGKGADKRGPAGRGREESAWGGRAEGKSGPGVAHAEGRGERARESWAGPRRRCGLPSFILSSSLFFFYTLTIRTIPFEFK
jgi:hypothetical protein